MDAATLQQLMSGPGYNMPLARAQLLLPGCNEALKKIGATTVLRAAHFLSQLGHESVYLIYTEEIASGQGYEGRADLGNTQPGDGVRFKGRSFMQITGRANYGAFSRWAYAQKLVNSPTYFVDHPTELALPRWAWLGAVWYWLQEHKKPWATQWTYCNQAADHDDIVGLTWLINGGQTGIDDRRARLARAKTFGTRLLPPAESTASTTQKEITMAKLDAEDRAFIAKTIKDTVEANALRLASFLTTGRGNAVFNPAVEGREWVDDAIVITNNDLKHEVDLGIIGDAPDSALAGKGDTHAAWSNEAIFKQNQAIQAQLAALIAKGNPEL